MIMVKGTFDQTKHCLPGTTNEKSFTFVNEIQNNNLIFHFAIILIHLAVIKFEMIPML